MAGFVAGPLSNNTVPGQAGLPDVYAAQLEVITQKLAAAEPQAKLLFALTSPSMCNPKGDGCVVRQGPLPPRTPHNPPTTPESIRNPHLFF